MEKIARICWNTHDWKRPSGSEGKSVYDKSYENAMGFGHEEWLLDDSKIMPDGYHYGFLQPLNVKSGKHVGKTYNIHLFTISPKKEKIYIGCLHNAIGVSAEESKKVYSYYKKCGWISEMKEDIKFARGVVKDISPDWFFNVKFKFSDASINYSNQPIIKSDTLGHRYNLMDKSGDFEFELDEEGNFETLDTSIIYRTNNAGEVLIDRCTNGFRMQYVKFFKATICIFTLKKNPKKEASKKLT